MSGPSANATHGLRRTSDDKKNAILALLRDPEWSKWSDRQIGEHVRCDHKTVAKYRRELLKPAEILSAAMTPEDEAGEFPTPSEPPSSEQAPPGGGVFAIFLAKIPVSPSLWLGCRVARVMAAANAGVISTLHAA